MILTGIAVADFLVMLEYIPFTIYMNLLDTENRSPEEEVTKKKRLDLHLISVLSWLGHIHGVPHQLHGDDPHRGHLAHLLPRHMEVHDQVKLAEKLLMKNSLSRFIMIKLNLPRNC